MTTDYHDTTTTNPNYAALIQRVLDNEKEFERYTRPRGCNIHDIRTCPVDKRRYLLFGPGDLADTPDDKVIYHMTHAVCLDDAVRHIKAWHGECDVLPLYELHWVVYPDVVEAWKRGEDVDVYDTCDWEDFRAYPITVVDSCGDEYYKYYILA